MMRNTGRLLALTLLPLAGGCESPTRSVVAGLEGVYALQAIGSASLPALVYETSSLSVVVISDTIRFDGTPRAHRVRVQEVTRAGETEPTRENHESEFSYGLLGDRIEITFVCPPNANCAPGPHLVGRIDDQTLLIDNALDDYLYERVPEG